MTHTINTTVDRILLADETGFPWSKTKLVPVGIPHLRPFNISDEGELDLTTVYQVPTEAIPVGKLRLEPGDILFNNTNSVELVGKSALVNVGLTAGFSNHMTRLRVDARRIEPAYFAFWLRRLRSTGYFTAQATRWVSQAAYKASELRKITLDLPALDEQRRIVDILSRAEGIVRLRREAQTKAAELVPAIFSEMFGDPSTNPKGWPTKPLSEVASVISGLAKGRVLAAGEGVELPYMRVANVKDGFLDLAEVKSIKVKHSEIDKLLIEPGDLLMTEGGDPDKLGRAALWGGEIARCVHQNHIFKVRSNRAHVRPTYLRSLVGSTYGKAYFLSVAKKTTGIASINKTQLSAFPVVLPPIADQAAFESRVAAVEAIVARQREAGSAAATMWDALLSRSFAYVNGGPNPRLFAAE